MHKCRMKCISSSTYEGYKAPWTLTKEMKFQKWYMYTNPSAMDDVSHVQQKGNSPEDARD